MINLHEKSSVVEFIISISLFFSYIFLKNQQNIFSYYYLKKHQFFSQKMDSKSILAPVKKLL